MTLSLRLKIVLAVVIPPIIAVASLFYFGLESVDELGQESQDLLIEENKKQSEINLKRVVEDNASIINYIFTELGLDISKIATLIKSGYIISDPAITENIFLAENGIGTNFSDEITSLFIPPQIFDRQELYIKDLFASKKLDEIAPIYLEQSDEYIAIYYGSKNGLTRYYPNIDLASALPPDFNVTGRPWYLVSSATGSQAHNWSEVYEDATGNGYLITVSAPVHDAQGNLAGVVGADISLNKMQGYLAELGLKGRGFFVLIDNLGNFIEFSEEAKIFLKNPNNFNNVSDFKPLIFEEYNSYLKGQAKISYPQIEGSEYFSYFTALDSVNWTLAYFESTGDVRLVGKKLEKEIGYLANSIVVKQFFLTATLILLVLSIAGFIIGRGITIPLAKLKEASNKISKGDFNYPLNINGRDEIGDLAVNFKNMMTKIKESQKSLENKNISMAKAVKDKTLALENALSELSGDKSELETQRAATLNILEDIYESKEELESLNTALRNKSFELEALKSFSDELTSIFNLDEALVIVNKYLSQVLDYNLATYLIFDDGQEGELFYKTYAKDGVNREFLSQVQEEIVKYIDYQKDKGHNIADIKQRKPDLIGDLNDQTGIQKAATFMLPLLIGGRLLGVFHIASFDIDKYKKKESKGFFNAMAATLSVAVARLQAINKFQNSRTETLVKSLEDGVIMFNSEGKVLLVNPKADKIVRVKINEDIASVLEKLVKEDFKNIVKEVIQEKQTKAIEEAELDSSIFEIFIVPVKDHENKVSSGAVIIHDITHIKEVDRMKTEFVSVASHQLRTPLTAIKLFTEMLLNSNGKDNQKDRKEYLNNIYQSTERMVVLVNDLLNMSRLESGRLKIEPVETELCEFIRDIINEIMPVAVAKKVVIDFSPKEKLTVKVDPNLMRQVVHNLVSNAVRYSKSGEGEVRVSFKKKEDKVVVSVQDNGIGIPKKMQERIFEKFFRADNAIKIATEGTGLGLYVSKMIIESSGGKLWFDSVEDKGTSFYISIPISGMKKKEGEKGVAV
jgi:PAS domain S-box-containing protein